MRTLALALLVVSCGGRVDVESAPARVRCCVVVLGERQAPVPIATCHAFAADEEGDRAELAAWRACQGTWVGGL